MTKTYEIDIDPCPKPRMTQRDKWMRRSCVQRYYDFCDNFREKFPFSEFPNEIIVDFYLKMPNSWSKKKKKSMIDQPHQQKPDIDNLCKAVFDALKIDDAHIWKIQASKRWSDRGLIVLIF